MAITISGDTPNFTSASLTTPTLTSPTITTPTLTSPTITGAVVSSMASSVITSGTVVTPSGASIEFTGIPSWVRKITVSFVGVSFTASNQIPMIQIGDSGGIETTGYESGIIFGAGAAADSSTSGVLCGTTGIAAAATQNGQINIALLTGNTWTFAVNTYSTSVGAGAGCGVKTLSATLDRVRLTSSTAGTFDAGSINILYE